MIPCEASRVLERLPDRRVGLGHPERQVRSGGRRGGTCSMSAQLLPIGGALGLPPRQPEARVPGQTFVPGLRRVLSQRLERRQSRPRPRRQGQEPDRRGSKGQVLFVSRRPASDCFGHLGNLTSTAVTSVSAQGRGAGFAAQTLRPPEAAQPHQGCVTCRTDSPDVPITSLSEQVSRNC